MTLIRILAFVRVALIPLAVMKILLDRDDFPNSRYEYAAWTLVGAYARARAAPGRALVSLARPAPVSRGTQCRQRLRDHVRPDVRVRVGACSAPAGTALPGRARGGPLLPARRRADRRRGDAADPAPPRSLQARAVRDPAPLRRARAPGHRRGRARRRGRSARRHGAQPGGRRRGAGGRGGAAARRARPPRRPARGDQPRSRVRSARRSTSTVRSPRSPASCGACSRSTVRRSCSPRRARRA